MRIDIICVIPELLKSFLGHSIIKRAQTNKIANIHIHNLRDYSLDKHKRIDDYCYGGGAGMVLKIEPFDRCISLLKKKNTYDEIIYLTPDGELLTQSLTNKLSCLNNIILVCGHYKGIDQRIRDHFITKEISIGEYVVSGGEIPAAVLTDSIIRILPGAIGNECSALEDSFQDDLLAPPIYTRPKEYKGLKVPEILTSGNFKEIQLWKEKKILERSKKKLIN